MAPHLPLETSRRIEFLDPMRGFAILAVFAFHCLRASTNFENLFPWNGWVADIWNEPIYKLALVPFNLGACGVPVFFVISGFCIHTSFSRRPDPWFKDFLLKRFLRIYPPYLIPLFLFAFVYPFGDLDLSSPRESTNFFAHLFLVHNLYDLEIFSGINPSFWSIAVEAQLYAIYPFMFLLARWQGWKRTLLICSTIELSIRFMFATALVEGASLDRAITSSPLAYVFSWGIGAAIADAYMRREELPLGKQNFIAWLGLSLVSPHVMPMNAFTFLIHSVTAGVFVARSLNGERLLPRLPGSNLISRHLGFVGTISYSFYLIHQPLVNRVEPLARRLTGIDLPPAATLAMCFLSWPLLLGLAWVMYRCVEVPSIAVARTLTSPKRRAAPLKKLERKSPVA